ncbi:TAXI family TRAP transporter solute-binding subunit [Paenisporosarcina sp. TG20]|uniref:TAXI family TRAP transporter solute-binding subunit n=1 Tax=Paenisporosarcina sp. TG20 TaxID=1211706 RepID=UPI0003043F18|nr:TAXI family TRAP transporter solute-binding subunit [Paenisporosarcina sp. TG20]
MKTKFIKGIATVLLASAVLAACGTEESAEPTNGEEAKGLDTNLVTIATGGASGPYNIIGTALGERYSSELGINSKTQTTGASVENVNLIMQEKVEMAFLMSDVLSEAVEGVGNFPEKVENISQIAALYPNFVQIVTTVDSGINSFEDLKGKRIAVGAQNSGVEVNARNLLEGHGITYDDVEEDYLGYAEAADALKAGKLDAAFLTSGIPNASLMELEQGLDMKLVPVDPEKIKEIAQDQAYFIAMDIPAGTYGNEEAVPTAAIMNALVVRSDMSDDDVYKLTKSFFEGLGELANAHQAAADISVEAAQQGMVAPVHPGAQRYYDEQ